jgi:hypothetical protein
MGNEGKYLYGGLSGAQLPTDSFELGEGVVLKRTYAHLMSPCLMAFARPGSEGYHPTPWKAAKGGFGFDIEIEIRVPNTSILSSNADPRETIWWIAALLRIARVPFLIVTAISDQSFETAQESKVEPVIEPFETEPRIMASSEKSSPEIPSDTLDWVKEKWLDGGKLLNSNPSFYSALKAFDTATVRGKTSSSLLALWGGLEQIFSPSPGELRYRVSSMLASYLEPPGESRLELYKKILKLYNDRSVAAHTARQIEHGPLVETYVLMRNTLVRIIDENVIPSQQDLEARLFGCV